MRDGSCCIDTKMESIGFSRASSLRIGLMQCHVQIGQQLVIEDLPLGFSACELIRLRNSASDIAVSIHRSCGSELCKALITD